jgi:hypothetical protein
MMHGGGGLEAHGGGVSMDVCGCGGMEASTAAFRPSRAPPPPCPMEEHDDDSTTTNGLRRSGRASNNERAGSDGSTTTTVVVVLVIIKRRGAVLQLALRSSGIKWQPDGGGFGWVQEFFIIRN